MYPLNLHGHQASLKQLVQTRMPKACSSPPYQAPLVYKDKHHLPVAPLLLATYFLSSSKRCRLHLQIFSVWPLLITSTVPTLGQTTDSCPLDSAIVTNCNRCLFSSKQWPEWSFQNGNQAQHKLSRSKSQEWLTRPSCSSRTLPLPLAPRFSFSSLSGYIPVPPTQQSTPAPGPLHVTCPLPGYSSSDIYKTFILISFGSQLKRHAVRDAFLS